MLRRTLPVLKKPDTRSSASTPVPRAQRMSRIDQAPATPQQPEEKLRRLARNVDAWTEKRSDKSLWESWMADWLEKQYPERNRRAGVAESSVSPQLHGGENRTPRLFSISVVDHKQS